MILAQHFECYTFRPKNLFRLLNLIINVINLNMIKKDEFGGGTEQIYSLQR